MMHRKGEEGRESLKINMIVTLAKGKRVEWFISS
jgi:hypothetical protein